MSRNFSQTFNVAALVLISVALVGAFFEQFVKHELPCPLCLLQRAAFIGVGIGLAMNIRFGAKPSHYVIALVATAIGLVISGRQTLLHVAPGADPYGSALWGLHLYVWSFLLFVAIGAAIVLMLISEWAHQSSGAPMLRLPVVVSVGLIALLSLLALSNGIATVFECGSGMCPDDPIDWLIPG
ncbi:disulfide bond formation protein B [Pandoraea oxalativorans]|uniref:Disulfide bond formation protein DsbB n=1 Tax=Pandoraea oxalativorans TaxID=573737 RepID=A0A0G3IBX7_9BURK|nr:disulfide bond formation protein B [Pandoraea oxalativorans]AKK24709.1 hypothetical protein MB84_28225 [Pandoraea oxalativorans]